MTGIAIFLVAGASSIAQQSIASWTYEKGATKLALTGVFEPPPPTGYQPVRAEMQNATGDARSWRLDFASSEGWNGKSQTKSSFDVAIEAGQSHGTLLMVPVAGDSGTMRYGGGGRHSLRVTAASGQVSTETSETSDERVQQFPAIAISDALARKSLTQLGDEVRKSITGGSYGPNVFGSRFIPDQLPEDWLGFSGFDYVMMTSDEWLALTPGTRTALLQWVSFDGNLHLYRSNDTTTLASLGLASADPTLLERGLGQVAVKTWNGDTLDAPATVFAYKSGENLGSHLSDGYDSPGKWKLPTLLGERSFAGWQVVVFLLAFGILVGPVNLFVLAPAGRRHKLFLTTPLISLGASAALIGLILIQDGTGGQGRRFVAIQISPGDAAAYVTQEQLSRTGVVLGSAFELPRPGLCHQVVLADSPWAKFSNSRSSQPMDVRVDGAKLGGNWFQSRAIQGQFLRSMVPTRGRIELMPDTPPDQPPRIVSSLDFDLTTFAYFDANGQEWWAPSTVTKGQPLTLKKADGPSPSWPPPARDALASASDGLGRELKKSLDRKPRFIATAAAAPGYTIETLRSIRWKDDAILVFGHFDAKP